MTPGKWHQLFQDFYEVLKGKTLEEIRDGCRRYWEGANEFWPTPGVFLQWCKNPYANPPRRYAPLPNLPPPMPVADVLALIERTRAKHKFRPPVLVRADDVKQAILERQPLVMTPDLHERERSLRKQRKVSP